MKSTKVKSRNRADSQVVRIARHKKGPRHTARLLIRSRRPLHKRVFLHPISVFVLLCAGVFIVTWTYRVAADSFTITGKVAAPALTESAIITSPSDSVTIHTNTTSIKGTCPPNSYVVLTRNGLMSGVGLCGAGNSFEISASLYPGVNTLSAQDYNITDDKGPVSASINVTYVFDLTTAPGNASSTVPSTSYPYSNAQSAADLPILTSTYSYQAFAVNSKINWNLDISGGVAPYALHVDWGDGTMLDLIISKARVLPLSHKYATTGRYTVTFKILDKVKGETVLQLIAIVQTPIFSASSGSTDNTTFPAGNGDFSSIISSTLPVLVKHWVAAAWVSYATVSLMSISFWLGERQEIAQLILRKHTAPRRRKLI
jgi:hypothetical protein